MKRLLSEWWSINWCIQSVKVSYETLTCITFSLLFSTETTPKPTKCQMDKPRQAQTLDPIDCAIGPCSDVTSSFPHLGYCLLPTNPFPRHHYKISSLPFDDSCVCVCTYDKFVWIYIFTHLDEMWYYLNRIV